MNEMSERGDNKVDVEFLPPKKVEYLLRNVPNPCSDDFYSFPDPFEEVVRIELNHAVERSLDSLPLREAKAVRMAFGIGGDEYTQVEIAEELGLSRPRCHQLLHKGIWRLRQPGKRMLLQDFADNNWV